MLKRLLKLLKNKLTYSRFNREELQKDLWACYLHDRNFNNDLENNLLHKVIHCGAYCCLHDVKEYQTKEYFPYAQKYSDLINKYVPNIDLEYPNNIKYLYEQLKKDILSSY